MDMQNRKGRKMSDGADADRIKELEEKLLSATMDGYDMAKHEYRDRIEELERRLTTAVDALETIRFFSGVHAAGSDLEHIKESVNDVANKALVTVK
jgi:phage baseplate assembly protein W